MKKKDRIVCFALLTIASISTKAIAIIWQDPLTEISAGLPHNGASGTQSGGLSLSSLSAMIEGGNRALSANTMANAAGIIEYCSQNKLTSITNAKIIQKQLVLSLELNHPDNKRAKEDYTQGLSGLLNTRNGQQLDMRDLSHSELAIKVKTQTCDLVLKQSINYLSQ